MAARSARIATRPIYGFFQKKTESDLTTSGARSDWNLETRPKASRGMETVRSPPRFPSDRTSPSLGNRYHFRDYSFLFSLLLAFSQYWSCQSGPCTHLKLDASVVLPCPLYCVTSGKWQIGTE